MRKRNVQTELHRTFIMLHWVSIGLIMASKNDNIQLISYRYLMSNHINSYYVSGQVYKNHESPNITNTKSAINYILQVCTLMYHTSANVDKNSGFGKTAGTRHPLPPNQKKIVTHTYTSKNRRTCRSCGSVKKYIFMLA